MGDAVIKEEWRDIEGYEGYYQVSNKGQIRSVDRVTPNKQGGVRRSKGKILKQTIGTTGYPTVSLCKNGKAPTRSSHRFVAITFLDPIDGKIWVNHKDGDKTNNNVENLEFCNPAENNQHAYDTGLKRYRNKLNDIDILIIRDFDRRKMLKHGEIAKLFGINRSMVSRICRYGAWKWVP